MLLAIYAGSVRRVKIKTQEDEWMADQFPLAVSELTSLHFIYRLERAVYHIRTLRYGLRLKQVAKDATTLTDIARVML